jgi:GT2 family glycosyltransferase
MKPNIAIVILNWRGADNTIQCVESLRKISYPSYKIFVVDNGSGGREVKRLRKSLNDCVLILNNSNLGFAGGVNVGIRKALLDPQVKYILLLNNDTVVTPDFLTNMFQIAKEKKVDMVSPTIMSATNHNNVDRLGIVLSKALLGYDMKKQEGTQPFCPSGCCALYSKKLLEDIEHSHGHLFDEDFFMYAEDTDLGWRARLLGYKAALAEKAIIYHTGFASNALASTDPQYLGHRNSVWYVIKNASLKQLWHLGGWWIAGQTTEVIAVALREMPASVLKAKWDALLGLPPMLRKRKIIQANRRVTAQQIRQAIDSRPFYIHPPRLSPLGFLWRLADFIVKSVMSLSKRLILTYKRNTK